MRVYQSHFDQLPSSAYNQSVQRAIKEEDDKLEDLWRPLYCRDKQRQEMNPSGAVSRLPVDGANLPPFLASDSVRQVQMGSGDLRLTPRARHTLLQRSNMQVKMSFQPLKKTDNVPSKEKHSLFWCETAGVLPIRCWIYIITVICCQQYYSFLCEWCKKCLYSQLIFIYLF